MSEIKIEPLNTDRLTEYSTWFDNWDTTDLLFKHAAYTEASTRNADSWAGSIDGQVVAIAFLSTDIMRNGHIFFAVKPTERRKGIGTAMMSAVLSIPEVKNLTSSKVTLTPDNVGGQKVLRKNGFVQTGSNHDGLMEFEKL